MPARNAFDFIEKPAAEDLSGSNTGGSKAHERLKKQMNNLKRVNRLNF